MADRVLSRKNFLRLLVALAGLILLLVAAGFGFAQQLLCVDSGEVRADALVVLGGGSYERPVRAAELFHAQVAPKIIVTGVGDCETNRQLLLSKGVPASAIIMEPNAHTTRENVLFTLPLLREIGAHRVVLVTSWYHSRRTLHCFRHYAPDLRFFSRPAYFGYPRVEWRRQGMTHYIRAEFFKLAGYWICYGVSPF